MMYNMEMKVNYILLAHHTKYNKYIECLYLQLITNIMNSCWELYDICLCQDERSVTIKAAIQCIEEGCIAK